MIGIIDYGSGNVGAISDIYKQQNIPHVVSRDLAVLRSAHRYLLPGVGAFDNTVRALHEHGIVQFIQEEVVTGGKMLAGICVGMQVLAHSSEEGRLPGLGLIPGRVQRIDDSQLARPPRLPHMGWNSIECSRPSKLLDGIDPDRGFYFLHSYCFVPDDATHSLATVTYGGTVHCVVSKENVFGIQFHPEKSHSNGVKVLRNFAEA